MAREEFCKGLAYDMEDGGYVGGDAIVTVVYRGDGLIQVTMEDGTTFNLNVTTAR